MDQKLQLLAGIPLFSAFRAKDLEAVGQLVDEVDFGEGRVVMRQGEFGHEVYVIIDGGVAIERDGHRIADIGPGDILGEMALIAQIPRTATATTTTPTRMLVLGQGQFRDLISRFPTIQAAVLESLAKRIATLEPDRC